jgi:hypothetical protein
MDSPRARALCFEYIEALLCGAPEERLEALREKHASLSTDEWQAWLRYVQGADAVMYVREHLSAHPGAIFMPAEVLEALEQKHKKIQARLAYILEEFQKLVRALEEKGISCIALKGIYLSQAVYKSVTQRPFGDIDVLCRPRDVKDVMETAYRLGYSPPPPKLQHWLERCYFEVPVAHHVGRMPFFLDIHWHLAPSHRYRIDLGGVWQRSVPWQGEALRVLCPEDLLLHLALHAAKSYFALPWTRWRDFAQGIQTLPVDMDVLMERAEKWRMRTVFYAALRMAALRTPDTVLDEVLERFPVSPFRKAALEKWIVHDGERTRSSWEHMEVVPRTRKELINVLVCDHPLTSLGAEFPRFCKWLRYGSEPRREVQRWMETLAELAG